MRNIFNKNAIVALFATLALNATAISLQADECCETPRCNRLYIGGFGGGIYSDSSDISQFGTAFFPEALGGPLSIIADGHLNKTSTGFGGVQLGYEWSNPFNFDSIGSISAAAELEAFFFNGKKKGDLTNETLVGLDEHLFHDFAWIQV